MCWFVWVYWIVMSWWGAFTYGAQSGRRSSDTGGGTVLQGTGAQLHGGDLWGSGGAGWLSLGCLRLGRQIQGLSTLVLQNSNTCGPVWFLFSFETGEPSKLPAGVKSADRTPGRTKQEVVSKCSQATRKNIVIVFAQLADIKYRMVSRIATTQAACSTAMLGQTREQGQSGHTKACKYKQAQYLNISHKWCTKYVHRLESFLSLQATRGGRLWPCGRPSMGYKW